MHGSSQMTCGTRALEAKTAEEAGGLQPPEGKGHEM